MRPNKYPSNCVVVVAAVFVILSWTNSLCGQTTSFTYQGRLTDTGAPANGSYDLQFGLFDNSSGGTQIGSTLTRMGVAVSAGTFAVQLDFGVSAFQGADRFLEIGVRPSGGGNFTTLSPRQQISSTPYAIRTLSTATADALSSACVACVQDSQINQVGGSKVTGTIPVASMPAGSSNYVQNTTSQQSSANFNISGNGTVGGNLIASGSVGIGINAPTTRLDVRGHLTLDAGTDPILNTGTGNTELNRYLELINSPSSQSASGLKAGGLLVADSYSFGNPGKNDLIVKGNTGMGLSNPVSKLHLFGSANIANPFRGLTIDQTVNLNSNLTGYAMKVTTTTGGVTGTNFLIDALGNTGVGTASPSQRLHVAQSGDYQLRLENPASGGGFWNIGQADNSFHSSGGKLIFVPNTTESTNAAVVFTNTGNVGIGTATPTARLSVFGAGAFNASGAARFDLFNATRGDGYLQHALDNGSWQLATINSALTRLLVDSSGTFTAFGNAAQARDKGGFVKAMVYVSSDGTIARCYNSQTSNSTVPCGFSIDHFTNGGYTVDFGFQISDRFYSVTAHYCSGCFQGSKNIGADFEEFTSTSLHIFTFRTNTTDTADEDFVVIVY